MWCVETHPEGVPQADPRGETTGDLALGESRTSHHRTALQVGFYQGFEVVRKISQCDLGERRLRKTVTKGYTMGRVEVT